MRTDYVLYTSIGISEHFWHKWGHLSCDMTSSIISPLSILNIWWRGCWQLKVNSQSLPPSPDKNTIAISFAILNSQELFSVSFLRQITLWFGNPKSFQSLQNAQRDTTNFAVNKETPGTFVPRHQGTFRIIPSKQAGLETWPRYGI